MANTSLWAITAKRREDFTEREKELWFGEIEYGYAPVTDKESAIKDSKTKKSVSLHGPQVKVKQKL